MGQDLVLHAIGEEGVRFFFAQVFKRKHRDAFRRDVAGATGCICALKENRSCESDHRFPCAKVA